MPASPALSQPRLSLPHAALPSPAYSAAVLARGMPGNASHPDGSPAPAPAHCRTRALLRRVREQGHLEIRPVLHVMTMSKRKKMSTAGAHPVTWCQCVSRHGCLQREASTKARRRHVATASGLTAPVSNGSVGMMVHSGSNQWYAAPTAQSQIYRVPPLLLVFVPPTLATTRAQSITASRRRSAGKAHPRQPHACQHVRGNVYRGRRGRATVDNARTNDRRCDDGRIRCIGTQGHGRAMRTDSESRFVTRL